MMKALMDEVRFENGGVVVHMRKLHMRKGAGLKLLTKDPHENETR